MDPTEKLSELLVKLDLLLYENYEDWLFYLWIIQIKLKRGKPTPLIKHYHKILEVRNDLKFYSCYEAFKEAWDYGKTLEEDFDMWTADMHKRMEERYESL